MDKKDWTKHFTPGRTICILLLIISLSVVGGYWADGCQSLVRLISAGCMTLLTVALLLLFEGKLSSKWNALTRMKRCAIIAAALALALSIPATSMTEKISNQFYVDITVVTEKNAEAQGREAWIHEILLDNERKVDLATLSLSEDWHYDAAAGSIWANITEDRESTVLTIGPYTNVKTITFALGMHQWSGYLKFVTPSTEHVADLYSADASSTSRYFEAPVIHVLWENMSVWDIAMLLLGYLYLFILATLLLIDLATVKGIFTAGYAVICVVLWLTSSLIEPAQSALCFITILSCASCYICNKQEYQTSISAKKYVVLISVVAMYASFASFGYRLFLAGDTMTIDRNRIFYFLLGTIWFFPVISMILMLLERWGRQAVSRDLLRQKLSRRMVGCLASLIALACMTLPFIAFFPGFFPADAVDQLRQIQTGQYNNWHPVVHTWLMQLVLTFVNHPAAVVYAQLMCFAILIGRVAVIPYDYGVKPKTIFLGVALFALLPNQAVANLSPLKDFPFTYVFVWATILLFEIALDVNKLKKPGFLIQLAVSMFLLKELRHNGIVPLLFMAGVLLYVTIKCWKTIKFRAVITLVAAFCSIGVTEGPIFTLAKVSPNPVSMYITMFCGVGACLHHDKDLSEETMVRLEDVMSMDNWKKYYGRFVGHDNYLWGGGEDNRMDLSSFGFSESFKIYLEALTRYPDTVIKDRFDGMNIMWDVSQPDDEDSFNARIFDFVITNKNLGLGFEGVEDGIMYYIRTPLANFYRNYAYFAFPGERTQDQVTDMLLWRSGPYLIFFLVLAIYWVKNRLYRMWWAAMPMIGNIAAMVLVLYHQSFRYIYFIQLCVLTLAFMTFLMQRKQQENTNNAVFENV